MGNGTKIENKHSIRMAIELRTPVSESSTKISKFHAPTGSEHKFHKARIENWPPIKFKLGFPDWESTAITTDWEPAEWQSPYWEHAVRQLKLSDIAFNLNLVSFFTERRKLNCASVPKSHSHHPGWHRPSIEQKPTTIGLIIYKHSRSTKFFTSLVIRLRESSRTPRLTKGNLGLTSYPPSIPLINTRNKKIKP